MRHNVYSIYLGTVQSSAYAWWAERLNVKSAFLPSARLLVLDEETSVVGKYVGGPTSLERDYELNSKGRRKSSKRSDRGPAERSAAFGVLLSLQISSGGGEASVSMVSVHCSSLL